MTDEIAPTDELQRRASVAGLRRLLRAGAIDAAQFAAMRRHVLTPVRWLGLVRNALLGLGTALVLAGTIYLFAFNWEELGRFSKLGVVAVAHFGCVVAAAVRGRATLTGKVLITAAAVFVGLFLAVFGQIYQTGADAYELFAGWCVLIVPYVLAAEFTALWVLWFLLGHAAVLAAWNQVLRPAEVAMELPFTLLAVAGTGLLALRELGARRGVPWLQERWARYVGLLAVLVVLTLPVGTWLFERSEPVTALSMAIWLLGVAALGAAAWRLVPDVGATSLIALDVCVVIDCVLGKGLFESDTDAVAVLFLLTVATLLMFAGAGALLRVQHRQLAISPGGEA